jgi:hypothetical protein
MKNTEYWRENTDTVKAKQVLTLMSHRLIEGIQEWMEVVNGEIRFMDYERQRAMLLYEVRVRGISSLTRLRYPIRILSKAATGLEMNTRISHLEILKG